MIPGASIFVYLLPLAAAPVLFHLLMRRQRKMVLFSTRMFFDSMKPRLSFHQKFREPLLLAARTLLLLFLLLALARLSIPGLSGVVGLSGQQAVVIVVDNSSSMAGTVEGSDRTKLTVAVEGARALLKNMDPRGKAAIVLLVPDSSTDRFGGGMTTDKETLMSFLQSIQVTEATGDASKAMLRATALLTEDSPGGGGSMHVFTDLQEAEWKTPALAANDMASEASVFLHRVPTAETSLPNICLLRATVSSRRILPNQPYSLEVLLRNDGAKDFQVRVNRKDSEHSVAEIINVDIAAGAQKLVKLPLQPKTPGRHWVRIWIEGDGFDGDNRVFVPYICERKGDIYFLGEQETGTFGLLPLAFSPSGDGRLTSLVPSFVSRETIESRLQQKTPMLVVMTWTDVSTLDDQTSALLDQYTQQGGNILVLPAVDTGESFSESTGAAPAWLGAKRGSLKSVPISVPLHVADQSSPFWSDIRGLDGRVRIGNAFVKQYYPISLEQDAGYVALLSANEDRGLLAIRKHGKGQIVVSGMAFGRTGAWSTLPRQKTFLVMAQPIALGAVSSLSNQRLSIVAGQSPRLLPGEGNEMSITTLLGDQVDWSGLKDQSPNLVRGGAYIATLGNRETCLTVLPSELEGHSVFIEDSEIGALEGIPHGVSILSDEDDFRDELEQSMAGTSLYLPFLLLALAFMMAEGLLGSPAKKWKDNTKEDSEQKPWVTSTQSSGEIA